METPKTIFEARSIVKDFPGQRVLNEVDFDIREGEIHALVGENGAGKSTLIKIFAGIYRPDRGKIFLNGKTVEFSNAWKSQQAGLSFIHQELNIIPHLSVAENIFLGRKKPRNLLRLVTLKKMLAAAQHIPDAISLDVDFRTPISMLSVIQQWKVVINRALAANPRIIFMDEPTASLTYDEVKELFRSIQHLRERGTAIVYVSHRMNEIFEIADRVTVLKDGVKVETASVKDTDMKRLFQMMLGRNLEEIFPEKELPREEVVLQLDRFVTKKSGKEINLTLHKGEILGLTGVVGSGRTELGRSIFGADQKLRGDVYVFGKKVNIQSPQDAISQSIAFVPEERHREGLVLPMSIIHNVTLASFQKFRRWAKFPVFDQKREETQVTKLLGSIDIRSNDLNSAATFLSGGNQQKCVLGKWLTREARIFIFDEPTRGIDIGSRVAIYKLIVELAKQGSGIILISSDLSEILGLSHRILIMDRGEIKHDIPSGQAELATIMKLCLDFNRPDESDESMPKTSAQKEDQ
jgi:ABC-type sugar transport system ATPase subunit